MHDDIRKRNRIKYFLYIYKTNNKYIEYSSKKIAEYKKQIINIETTFADISSIVNDGTPHTSGSDVNDKILFQIIKKDKEIDNIKKLILKETEKIQELIEMSNIISKVLAESDERTLKIFKKYYQDGCTAIQTCYLLNLSSSTFKRENNKLIKRIANEMEKEE